MIVDANMYWLPEALFTDEALQKQFFAAIPAQYGWHGRLETLPDSGKKQIVLEKPEGSANLNYVQGEYALEVQLADMDSAGIDVGFLKVPGCHEWLTPELCDIINEGIAAPAQASTVRLVALASIAPGSAEAVSELEYCAGTLGMKAVQLCAHYGDKYLDDPVFAPFFEKLNELGMTAYVHHTPVPVDYQSFLAYNNVRRSYGRVVDQGLAIGRELYSGMFDKYPNVRLVHSMLGGGFFAIAEMMMPHGPAPSESVSRFQAAGGDIRRQYRENICFETSHAQPWGKVQLEAAVKIYGADHIIYGSSYPVRKVWLTGGPDYVRSLDITEEEKALILGENAMRVYRM